MRPIFTSTIHPAPEFSREIKKIGLISTGDLCPFKKDKMIEIPTPAKKAAGRFHEKAAKSGRRLYYYPRRSTLNTQRRNVIGRPLFWRRPLFWYGSTSCRHISTSYHHLSTTNKTSSYINLQHYQLVILC